MQVRFEEFILNVTDRLNPLLRNGSYPDLIVQFVSEFEFDNLQNLLTTCPKLNVQVDDAELEQFLTTCEAWLQTTWNAYAETKAAYFLVPNTLMTKANTILAEELAKIRGGHAYEYLMPPLKCGDYHFASRDNCDLSGLKLNEFILSDEGQPIFIAEILQEAIDNHSEKLYCLNKDKQTKRTLTSAELVRVINHSQECALYYASIMSSIRQQQPVVDLESHKRKFYRKCAETNCEIGSDYGTEGKQRLLNVILNKITDRDHLVTALASYLKPEQWQTFLSYISDEDLSKFVLGMNQDALHQDILDDFSLKQAWLAEGNAKLSALLATNFNFICDKEHIYALYTCLTGMYSRLRKAGPDFKTYSGQFGATVTGYFGSMFASVGGLIEEPIRKIEKVIVSYILQNFYATMRPLPEYSDYLKSLATDEVSVKYQLNDEEVGVLKKLSPERIQKITESGELGAIWRRANQMYSKYIETKSTMSLLQ